MLAWRDKSVTLTLAGETVVLLGQRALYWPARERLVIADLHLGKGHVFRRSGIAVPRGATEDDLQRLGSLVAMTGAKSLWIVGDVLHGPASGVGWRDSWMRWRRAHATLQVAALVGNHDRALGRADLHIEALGEVAADGPFVFQHMPDWDAHDRHVIAGHVHPQARVPGVPRSWPVYWLRPGLTVLPAFSAFTGGYDVRGLRDGQLIACVDDEAIPIYSPDRTRFMRT
ncbi:ligase-associated DNA damage response endonuclease PdeM [Bordetella sp. 15P40C-2]|uniref:ligase-associated DNA damage response endonuclease PdeM n=1 Tax=Bordetella sp. 15P40C-2 TaxID=2572246 RepID=UPI0013282007|nr:ligase-associated DNA damage response endonuclease PdeM [Bordetella sp. 15P40C-2]MVW72033.1 ligase-associated DNA damage response endonuclease PdeM [Bordetella sp. 15P40C-2]